MNFILSRSHYAYNWQTIQDTDRDAVAGLGDRLSQAPPEEKQAIQEEILRRYHGYLMKYGVMIRRGQIPTLRGASNSDCKKFLGMMCSKIKGNVKTLDEAAKVLHFFFRSMEDDEIYDILASCLLTAAKRFDPNYSTKMATMVEAISGRRRRKSGAEVVLDEFEAEVGFPARAFLAVLERRGHIARVVAEDGRIAGYRRVAWPPKKSLYSTKLGFAYALQLGFRFALREYIRAENHQLENSGKVLQLNPVTNEVFEDGRNSYNSVNGRRLYSAPTRGNLAPSQTGLLPTSRNKRNFSRFGMAGLMKETGDGPYRGRVADCDLMQKDMDLSTISLGWVEKTNDPLFRNLGRQERHLLYLKFARSMSAEEIGEELGTGTAEVLSALRTLLDKLRKYATR